MTADPIPSLTRFGWRELARGVEIWVVLALRLARALVVYAVRHPRRVLAARRDPVARRGGHLRSMAPAGPTAGTSSSAAALA